MYKGIKCKLLLVYMFVVVVVFLGEGVGRLWIPKCTLIAMQHRLF